MDGLMQEQALVVTGILDFAARWHSESGITTHTVEGPTVFTSYALLRRRAALCALALRRAGVVAGDRVGTLAWNTHRHLEAWYGIMGCGAVCHTLNPRLFAEDLAWIIDHAGDEILLVDEPFAPLVAAILPLCPRVRLVIYLTDEAHMPQSNPTTTSVPTACYETWIGAESGNLTSKFAWTPVPETAACGLCYTSGTTGRPKGVLYSHRSNYLHATSMCMTDSIGISSASTILAVVPMFHANSWAIAFAAPMVGAHLVLPGPHLDGPAVYDLLTSTRTTHTAGVPTVWLGLMQHLQDHNLTLPLLRVLVVGGAACPRAVVEYFQDVIGCDVRQMWGMTELSPCGSLGTVKGVDIASGVTGGAGTAGRNNGGVPGPASEELIQLKLTQGRPFIFCDWRIVGEDGKPLPHNGKAAGNVQVRGPTTLRAYYRADEPATNAEGWFDTGDVATLDPHGYMRITDRSKDVIKSGGEWISSIAVENAAVGHPGVAEAAVIAIPHPKWSERPLLIVVAKKGQAPTKDDIMAFLSDKIAKWWLPDDIIFTDELPHTATGKISKLDLREKFGGHKPGDAGPTSKL